MIQHPHINQCQCLGELPGNVAVCCTWFSYTGRVIMRKNHRGGIVFQGFADDFARMDAGAVDCALEQDFEFNYPVLVIQEQAGKNFLGQIAQSCRKIVAGNLWIL